MIQDAIDVMPFSSTAAFHSELFGELIGELIGEQQELPLHIFLAIELIFCISRHHDNDNPSISLMRQSQ
jgi:hypothetical protein